MKRCKKCGETKPLEDFYRCPGMRDGYRNDCKVCFQAASHERYVAIEYQHVGIGRNARHRLLYGVAGPELLGLQHPLDAGVGERRAHLFGAVAMDHDHLARCERARRREHVSEQRPAGERMQDLGPLRAHALALARGENEDF